MKIDLNAEHGLLSKHNFDIIMLLTDSDAYDVYLGKGKDTLHRRIQFILEFKNMKVWSAHYNNWVTKHYDYLKELIKHPEIYVIHHLKVVYSKGLQKDTQTEIVK